MSTLGGLQFASPVWLLLLILLPVWWLLARRRRPAAIVFSRVGTLAKGPRAGRALSRALAVLRNLALAAGVVALARPRSGAHAETTTSEGINIIIAFDISSSMLAQDFQPKDRLAVAKEKIEQFVTSRPSDRIGVVSFSGEALTQVPLTTDHAVVEQAIENLFPGQLEDGTAIGTAIAVAANRLKDAPGKSKVVVLLTDGVNNRGSIDPRTAAKAAAQFGIRIYGIGVGTEGMAPVPVGRGLFGLRYEMQRVEIDDALLSDVAAATGGRYFRARDPAALQRITSQIDALERTPVRSRTYVRYAELFRWPVSLMLVALAAELSIMAWKGPLP